MDGQVEVGAASCGAGVWARRAGAIKTAARARKSDKRRMEEFYIKAVAIQ